MRPPARAIPVAPPAPAARAHRAGPPTRAPRPRVTQPPLERTALCPVAFCVSPPPPPPPPPSPPAAPPSPTPSSFSSPPSATPQHLHVRRRPPRRQGDHLRPHLPHRRGFPGSDAANFWTDITLPIKPFNGNTNSLYLAGSDLGWSGSGTFTYSLETTMLNGHLVPARWGGGDPRLQLRRRNPRRLPHRDRVHPRAGNARGPRLRPARIPAPPRPPRR